MPKKRTLSDDQIKAGETRAQINGELKILVASLRSSIEATDEGCSVELTRAEAARILFGLNEYLSHPFYPPGTPPDPDKPDGGGEPGDLFNSGVEPDFDDTSLGDSGGDTGDPF